MGVYLSAAPAQSGRGALHPPGLGAVVQVDTNLLFWGIGILAAGVFLLGGKVQPRIQRARKKSLEAKVTAARKKLRALEAQA